MNSTMKNANGSIEEPLALLTFHQNQPYRTVVCLRIDFDEISLRFSQPALKFLYGDSPLRRVCFMQREWLRHFALYLLPDAVSA